MTALLTVFAYMVFVCLALVSYYRHQKRKSAIRRDG
jgi:hypothetical protein